MIRLCPCHPDVTVLSLNPTHPAMFCMETLLDSDTHCWDRLLENMGAAVASSARRTADRGRSLGCEAVKGEKTPTERHGSPPTRPDSSDKGHREAAAPQPTCPGSAHGWKTPGRTIWQFLLKLYMPIHFDLIILFQDTFIPEDKLVCI